MIIFLNKKTKYKKTNISSILTKLNKINIAMKGLIQNEDDSYNCNSRCEIPKELIINGKLLIKFNIINGDFILNFNKINTTLFSFDSLYEDGNYTKLTTLENFPKIINGNLFCDKNIIFNKIRNICNIKNKIYTYTKHHGWRIK
jgi:hypothetical protein